MIPLWQINRYLKASLELTREALLTGLLREATVQDFCEIGVFRGKLAAHLLETCPGITRYVMVDPWRHLPGWGKPSNLTDAQFDTIHAEAMTRVAAYQDKLEVLRDESRVALDAVADRSLDAIYVDGDHTLRGITIDLIRALPKLRRGGLLIGDDFTRNIWQHGEAFAPSEVFPFALYFAEAHGLPAFTLPQGQFVIVNTPRKGYRLFDYAGFADLSAREIYLPRGFRDD